MTLGFSTHINGQPTYFVEKILKGLPDKGTYFPAICKECGWKGMSSLCGTHQIADTGDWSDWACPKCGCESLDDCEGIELINNGYYHEAPIAPKLHTIRSDPKNRWKAGNKIHFVINNRTKDRFQFAPVLECKSVQNIRIRHSLIPYPPGVFVGDNLMYRLAPEEIEDLARNDGFNSVEDFFKWFDKDFDGKIIHWHENKY